MAITVTRRIAAVVLLGLIMAALGAASVPAASAGAQACNNAQFVLDVTIPDRTIMRSGEAFTKTWRLKNTGSCTWSTSYRLMYDSGDALGGPVSARLVRSVSRNSTADISVRLVAPSRPGTYTGYWQLADSASRRFGPKIRVVIVVPDSSRGETLPDTLTFMGGAGGGTTKDACASSYGDAGGQQVTLAPTWMREQGTEVCIYDQPAYSTVSLTLTSPTGKRYAGQFDVGSPLPGSPDWQGPNTVVGVPLMWPVTAAGGNWRLSVQGDGLRYSANISVSAAGRGSMELRASPLDSFNPFDTLDDGPLGYTLSYAAGERVQFSGNEYPPNAQVPLGIYREADAGDFSLVHSEMVAADSAGRFTMVYRIPETLPPGRYYAVARTTDFWSQMGEIYDILGHEGTTQFYIRPGVEDPVPAFSAYASQENGEPVRITIDAINSGRAATRGASLTVSSPDAERLEIERAEAPIIEPNSSNCNTATSHAWALDPQGPCSRVLKNGTNCRGTVQLAYPMAEGWYKPWATGETQRLTVRLWPLPGKSEVRVYVRMAMLIGASGCRIALEPGPDAADGVDQQAFPVQVIIVPVNR